MVLTWATAQDMLPLVGQIVTEVVQTRVRLDRLHCEKEGLDHRRHKLEWPERSRRYQLSEEINRDEGRLNGAREELYLLGLTLLDEETGQVGFPTIVNNRRAFFSWRPGEEGIQCWHFADDSSRRMVPAAWKEPNDKVKVGRRKI